MACLGILAAAFLGAVAFITYFHHGEHHLHGASYFIQFLVACGISTAYLTWRQEYTFSESIQTTIRTAISFLAGLYITASSTVSVPSIHSIDSQGPQVPESAVSGSSFKSDNGNKRISLSSPPIENMVQSFVPKALKKIHDTGRKAPFYDINKPITSIQTTRDEDLHKQRRKLWGSAFEKTRLPYYEASIHEIHANLLARIDRDSKDEDDGLVNVTRLINHYAFDVMGKVAYGTDFDMLGTGKSHKAIDMLNESMALIGFMLPIWLIRVAAAIPGLTRKWSKFVAYCFEQMENCRLKPDSPVIASSLLSPCKDRELTPAEKRVLHGEAQLLVVAGSDTTSAAIVCALYKLALNPQITVELREAISASLPVDETEIRAQHIKGIDILNGIINETLRLYPPIPTALWRLTPAEGVWIDEETYIPGNVVVSTPHYVLGRSEDLYERPDDFIPERWYSKREMIKYEDSFAPFTIGKEIPFFLNKPKVTTNTNHNSVAPDIGSYSCVGRPLAMLNLRMTLAKLIHTYDISLPSSMTMEEVQAAMEGSMKDNFTLMPGQLNLIFKRRNMARAGP
ncbi:benzoate 4-monooxygenase cytochrome P450, putative [Talaromyces stipitatus ATCC 10500]|uniref:Benzoate 4-monooxygenase cytochrome P450, putative n=1 Tax=Talaromyces stipitatus (strain ATCC 10500 / CBS 375.48 / QM 6759 / NRRL 1006) TaxID=441959 RepID=B8MUX6_TALSN|nr:benzoate 4-monooxygenase cytochrome P450, putative [Talaromyces stipitatus ATCC 10500]EED11744.1 benzoate 4-monooxygenase cytochrome P450, putative [Talaromyces stipitatus ATCC 10500]